MGFFLFDYFRCEPSELNFRLLAVNGFWPVETSNRIVQLVFSAYCYLCWFSILSMMFIQVLDLYLLRNDPLKLVSNFCSSDMTFLSIIKYLLIFFKAEKINHLHLHLKEFKKSVSNPEDVRILEAAEDRIMKTTKIFYGLAVPCVVAWMLYPGLESSDEKRVPFPYRLPVNFEESPVYEILYTYQSMSMVGYLVNILSNDLIYYGFVIRINAEYDILVKKFEKMECLIRPNNNNESEICYENSSTKNYNPDTSDRIVIHIKENVKFHQKITREIEQLRTIYSSPYLLHFLGVIALVGVLVVDFVVLSQGFRLLMLQRLLYGLCGLFDTFLVCFFSQKLQDRGMKLARTVYNLPWYEMTPKIRKELSIILLRTTKTRPLKAGNFFSLNLSAYLQFLKQSYNLTALLYQTVRK